MPIEEKRLISLICKELVKRRKDQQPNRKIGKRHVWKRKLI